ncbi:GntR family transcriptional regulator [Clostridium vincentii]|uniref:Putative HTH-type transcriptional regulator YydK n=1 Tax=Clostridium vincentii TaxID=52704 RepID=A0A2T0BK95_9CLOT|nr:GntR family transcriptional regulator [Clostridium vincentii]PRR84299.1 putative HTH-type transcriptional regulator YydK [Clostridium vincentii]
MEVKYKIIAKKIEENIIEGKYDNTKKLPTVEELMEIYKVSRSTIRQAINTLVDKGEVYQVQGSGIFIRETKKDGFINIQYMRGLSGDFIKNKIKTKVLELKVIKSDREISEKMKCNEGTDLYFIKRLRYLDNDAYTVEYSYYNKEIIPYLNTEIVEESIYSYISESLKLNIGFADKIIYCEPLTLEHSKLLGLKEGDGSLVIEDTVFLTNGLVFDTSKVIYNYKFAKLLSLSNYK